MKSIDDLQADLIEKLADAEHASWAHWMEYLFSKCQPTLIEYEDDTMSRSVLVIPEWGVERWTQQVETPYAELSEQEKQSDRNEVAKIIPIIEDYVDQRIQKALTDVIERVKKGLTSHENHL